MGIILTILTGIFFLMGAYLTKIIKSRNVSVLACSLALIILLNLMFLDILPELMDNFSIGCVFFIILGLFLSKIFDIFVPNHEHHHQEKNDDIKEHDDHLEHISVVSIVVLLLHNFIECVALYNLTGQDTKAGIMMCFGIALHNFPLGIQLGNMISGKKKIWLYILAISGALGGLTGLFLGSALSIIESYIISFTFGMLIYLSIFELLGAVYKSRKNKFTLYGIIIGILIILLSLFI